MSPVVETHKLTKSFDTRVAVADLDLTVHQGDIFGFLGQNGAGKSTTLRMLVGLVRATSGDISLLGHSIPREREAALRRVGTIVEAPAFYNHLTGFENLQILSSLTAPVTRHRFQEVLTAVQLGDRAGDKVRVYSHGMRQRLGLAQALLPRPELLVLDEPTDGLDPQGIRQIRELLVNLARAEGMTILLSSHLLHEVERICNRIAIIDEGKLLYQGSVQDLLELEQRYRIRTDRISQAFEFLSSELRLDVFRNGDQHLYLKIPESQVPSINHSLVSRGFRVYEISRHASSLEDIYLRLTAC